MINLLFRSISKSQKKNVLFETYEINKVFTQNNSRRWHVKVPLLLTFTQTKSHILFLQLYLKVFSSVSPFKYTEQNNILWIKYSHELHYNIKIIYLISLYYWQIMIDGCISVYRYTEIQCIVINTQLQLTYSQELTFE